MLELLYMKLVVDLLDANCNLRFMDAKTIKNLLKVEVEHELNVKVLDYRKKEITDHLIRNYGHLGSLVALDKLRLNAIGIRPILSSNTRCNIEFLLIACKNLYDHIESYYMIDIMNKMSRYFRRIKNGTFDPTEFLQNVVVEKLFFPFIEDEASIERQVQFEQSSPKKDDDISLKSLSEFVYLKNGGLKSLKRYLKFEFTKEEICEYTTTLIDLLSIDLTEEHAVIVKTLCHAIDYLEKSSHTKSPKRAEQIKLLEFEPL